jgi:hypothetical protein
MKETYNVRYIEAKAYIFVELIGFINSEDYIACWSEVLFLIKKHQSNKLVVDMRASKIISESNLKWLNDFYFPNAYKLFEHYKVARIMSGDLFNKFSINKLDKDRNKSNYSEESRDFADLKTGEDWLVSN